MIGLDKYTFSFTASGLRVNEIQKVIRHLKFGEKLDVVNDLGGGKSATGERILSDLKKRIDLLSQKETSLFLEGDFQFKKQIAFLSVCRAYLFIREFVIEVVREKYLVFDYQLTEGEFLTFYRRKHEEHSEMDSLTEGTQYKIKQITFKLLEQGGIIDSAKTKIIQPQLLDESLIGALKEVDSEWLKIFLFSDLDIQNTLV